MKMKTVNSSEQLASRSIAFTIRSSLFLNKSNILHHLPLHHLSLFDAREPALADEAGDAGHEEDEDGDAGDDDERDFPVFSVLISGFLSLLAVGVGPCRHFTMAELPYLWQTLITHIFNQGFHGVISPAFFNRKLWKFIVLVQNNELFLNLVIYYFL